MSEDDIDNMDFELPSDENISHQFGQMQVLETESGVSAETLARFKGSIILYPAYFDSRKSVAEGRRLGKSHAINTDMESGGYPITAVQLAQACGKLNLEVLLEEKKRYSRSYFAFGRIRILFDKKKGHSTSQFGLLRNKKQLMHAIAKLIPQIQQDMVKQVDMQMKDKDPNFKLTLTNFPYGMDPMASTLLRYEYGALPVMTETKINASKDDGKKKGKKKK